MKKINLGTISMGNTDAEESQFPQNVTEMEPIESNKTEPRCSRCSRNPQEYLTHKEVYYRPCEDIKECDYGEMSLDGQGRILDLTLTLKNVCPSKRVAVGVVLTEADEYNNEYPRGQKIVTVPAHNGATCQDIPVSNLRFVMPEDISVSGCNDMCGNNRHFIVRVAAHYIDVASNYCGSAEV